MGIFHFGWVPAVFLTFEPQARQHLARFETRQALEEDICCKWQQIVERFTRLGRIFGHQEDTWLML